jgi:hypothetical protein
MLGSADPSHRPRQRPLNPYIAQQPRTPSHARRFGPSTLICRGNVTALGLRWAAAADKRSPIAGAYERLVSGVLSCFNSRR